MHNTEQTLGTAIGELNCIRPDSRAPLDELTALAAARDCVDELLRYCVTELRSDAQMARTWADLAYALGPPSAPATKQRYGSNGVDVTADRGDRVRAFWRTSVGQFTWGFLPGREPVWLNDD